jgi:nicotine blue oxidoreductase
MADALVLAGYPRGRRGHPVLLGRRHWSGVADLALGDVGARPYLRAHAARVRLVDVADVADDADLDRAPDADRAPQGHRHADRDRDTSPERHA